MQISLNPHHKINHANRNSVSKNIISRNHRNSSFSFPNYNQIDKSLVNFCGSKFESPLDKYFGGCKIEKEFIRDILIEPLNQNGQLPSSLLLAFPDDYTQMQAIKGITQLSNADFLSVSSSDKYLNDNLRKIIVSAKDKYQKSGRQTVIIIDNAERAIGMTPAYARELSLIPLTIEDFAYLKLSGTNLKNVNFFKSLLDNVNKTSFGADDLKSPVTILFITKKPQYIHPDLITRDGKMKTVIFPIPCGRNIKNSISFETDKIKAKLNELKLNNDLFKNQMEQKETMEANSNLSDLSIDVENIPFQKIMSYTAQTNNNGILSNEKYQEIAIKSLKDYISEPKTPYSIHFIFNLASAKRDISYKEYQEYESMRCIFRK